MYRQMLTALLLIILGIITSACVNKSMYCNTSCTDNDLQTNVQVKIAAEPCLSAQNIRVTSYERNITLRGSVENPTQRHIAGQLAGSTSGVTAVKNYLKIKDRYNRPIN